MFYCAWRTLGIVDLRLSLQFLSDFLASVVDSFRYVRVNQLSMGFSQSNCEMLSFNKLVCWGTVISWAVLDKLAEVFSGIG